MRWPSNQTLQERTAMLSDQYNTLQNDVDMLKKHRTECDLLHEQHKEHKKRSDDAMNNLTESNMMLAKSITDMNVTLTKFTKIVENDQPTISIVRNVGIAWDVNKKIFMAVVVIATGIVSIVAAYNYFT